MGFFSRRQSDENFDSGDDDDVEKGHEGDRRQPASVFRSRGFLLGAAVLLFVILGFGCWVAIGAFQAKSNLELARSSAQDAKEALLRGSTDAASTSADEALARARSARDATHSPAWNIVAAVPWLGSPFKTGQQVTEVVLGLASDVLRPAADVGIAIAPDRLYSEGRVDVQLLRAQETELSKLSDNAKRLNGDAAAIADPRYVSLMSDARSELQTQISSITSVIENAALAARLVPSMMGADGPRTYFMGFQTNAEARGTGGLLGAYGILRFDNGQPSVDELAANDELSDAVAALDFGLEYDQQYGYAQPFTDIRNSNLSPHFPYAAQIWRGMWAEQTGVEVDGVIAIDPVALSYILGAIGPVKMADGEIVSRDNVVELTESTAYFRFPTDQVARQGFLQDIASAVVRKMTGPVKSPRQLLDALGKAVGERRIAVWSSFPAEQELLEQTPLAHVLPADDGPLAAVVVNNLGGNKLDYYLDTQIEYAADECQGETRASTVNVKLTNAVPDEPLPDYVASAAGLSPDLRIAVPPATNITSVRLFATEGSELSSVLLNGERVPAILNTELGHPVFEVQAIIPPGQSADVSFRLSEPTVPGKPRVPVQPLVETVVPKVLVPECSS